MAKKKKISKKAKKKLAARRKPFQEKEENKRVPDERRRIVAGKKVDPRVETLGIKKTIIKPATRGERKTSTTILDTNNEIIRQAGLSYPSEDTAGEEKELAIHQALNEKIKYQRKKLIKEQISKATTTKRVREIDDLLHGRKDMRLGFTDQYLKKHKLPPHLKFQEYPLFPMDEEVSRRRNRLQLFMQKDFYYTIDNNFVQYKVKESTLVNRIKKGENIGLWILNDYEKQVQKALEDTQEFYAENKTKMNSKRKKRFLKKIHVLEKLSEKIKMNREAIKQGSEKPLMSKKGDKNYKTERSGAYPIFVTVIGTEIIILA